MTTYDSKTGKLIIHAVKGKLVLCDWASSRLIDRHIRALNASDSDIETEELATGILNQYFSGNGINGSIQLRLAPTGTDFSKKVWEELMNIPFGTTISYKELADRVGSHPRPVARAVGNNPISIFIPCHRVIGADGSLTGYAGGIESKKYLLELEKLTIKCSLKDSL